MGNFGKTSLLTVAIVIFWGCLSGAQVNWMNFEQLDDSLSLKPKKVFVNFYADWCAYCKKMDRAVYRDAKVVSELNNNYYCVTMNIESEKKIKFRGHWFSNTQMKSQRNPTHDIALALGSRAGFEFSVPVVIILNEDLEVQGRYFEYISPKQMKAILKI